MKNIEGIKEAIATFRARKSLPKQITTVLFWIAFSILAAGVGTVAIGVIGSGVGTLTWIVAVDLLPQWMLMWAVSTTDTMFVAITMITGWITIFLAVVFARSCGKFIDWMEKDDE